MKYRIVGETLPAVICDLECGDYVINESGSMCWMTPNMKMETIGGGVGRMIGRMMSGEAPFFNKYTAENAPGQIAFASSFPGRILALEVTPDKPLILQKSAFLAGSSGIEFDTYFNKKMSTGLFSGEGFTMQKVTGNGIVFVEIDGHAEEYTLGHEQSMIVDTGNLAVMDHTCEIKVQTVPGVKNMLFGGEGIFNTVVTGPGKIILQTMPISKVASFVKALLRLR